MIKSITSRFLKNSSSDNPRVILLVLESSIQELHEQLEEALVRAKDRESSPSMTHRTIKAFCERKWNRVITVGRSLAQIIAEQKSIPRGESKKFELASRLFISARRFPRDLQKWIAKNQKHIDYLARAVSWGEKSDSAQEDEVFTHGSFTVHNVQQLDGKKLDNAKKLISQAESKIRSSQIPNVSSVLYGDLFLVGRIEGKKVVAWYYPESDQIHLRTLLRVRTNEVLTLIHELGHRYWRRFLNAEVKREWLSHHNQISDGRAVIPSVGDTIPVKIKGFRGNPTVTRIENSNYYLNDTKGYLTFRQVYNLMTKLAREANYPSQYASTDPEEHFCESFAMYALGTLSEEHVEAFERIIF